MQSNSIDKLKLDHRFKDISGQVFGRLIAVSPVAKSRGGAKWLCSCTCGGSRIVCRRELVRGETRSCGCLRRENSARMLMKHGMTDTPEHEVWMHIKRRCYSPKDIGYKNYGGRGIKVCDRWLVSFEAFFQDMGPRPSQNHSIDRIDNNGNYEPTNCRWATDIEQANNKRNNVIVEHAGRRRTIGEWSKLLGVSRVSLRHRVRRGTMHSYLLSRIPSGE